MKITSITLSHGITVNMGNYESERYDVTLTADVDGDHKAAADELFIEAGRLLALQLVARMAQKEADDKMFGKRTSEQNRINNTYACAEFSWIKQLYPTYAENIVAMIQEAQ